MKELIAKILTFWIPIKNIRKHTRKKIIKYFFFHSKEYRNSVKYLSYRLENERNIYAMVSIPWASTLYQRPQHLAIQISQKECVFLYAEHDKNIQNIEDHNEIIFVDKEIFYYLPHRIAKKINLFILSTDAHFKLKNILKLKKRGYKIIYDYIDDFDEKILGDKFEQLNVFNNIKKVNPDLVLTTAKKLYKQMLSIFPSEKVLLNPNGVDLKNFENIKKEIPVDLQAIVNQSKPIIGYYGAMAPWLDWELINKMAINRKNYNFVYIGVDYNDALKNLKQAENVFFLGAKDYSILPQYAQFFTCCIIPFERGNIAKTTNPLKLFEYMALGKPVVCTKDLYECYGYEGVYIAEDNEDFCSKLDSAISVSNQKLIINKLLETAKLNTWEKRAGDIIQHSPITKIKTKKIKKIVPYNIKKRRNLFKNIFNFKKKILVISANFSGGGLETRINTIVEKFGNKYDFSLLTKTNKKDMKIKPSNKFKHIYAWNEFNNIVENFDILDIHPFYAQELIDNSQLNNQKIIYTIHGEMSIEDYMDNFYKKFDSIQIVSTALYKKIIKKYPYFENKINLSKNYYNITNYNSNKKYNDNTNKILISLTNTGDWMYLKNILDLLPQTYKVHLIGYKNDNFDLSAYKNVIHEGFVDIKEYLSKNNFFCAFSRGGYATMDLVIRNIPTFCIYNRNDNAYLELLDKHNFTKLSEHNFVTYKLFNNKYFIEKFKEIENNRNLYCCQEELIDSNNSKLMNDYFENI